MTTSSGQISTTELIDISIQDARIKKKTVHSEMDSIKRLMRKVECKEEVATQAKEKADKYRLYVIAKIDELKKAQQIAKEANDMHAIEVYTMKAALATEMRELQVCVSSVLKEGDKSIADLDEMRRSVENRLTSAVMKKDAADTEKLENDKSFSYHRQQMEKLKEESKTLKEEAMENLKLQRFLNDRKRVINMLKKEISCNRLEVKLLKREIEDYYQDKKELSVTEEYCSLGPIIQEMIPSEEYGANGCFVVMRKGWLRDHTSWSFAQNSKNKAKKEWIQGEIKEAFADYKQGVFDMKGYGCYSDSEKDDFDMDTDTLQIS